MRLRLFGRGFGRDGFRSPIHDVRRGVWHLAYDKPVVVVWRQESGAIFFKQIFDNPWNDPWMFQALAKTKDEPRGKIEGKL